MKSIRRKSKAIEPLVSTLLGLEQKLSDEILSSCFAELEPTAVRAYLKEAARVLDGLGTTSEKKIQSQPVKSTVASSQQKTEKTRKLTLFTDGASRGNPGEAGAGILILDEQGREIYAQGIYLGCCTNNVAEYRALLSGIHEAIRLGGEELDIRLDSELIVRQIQGLYKVKNVKLKELFSEVIKKLGKFRKYTVVHVQREKNYRADRLANQAIDDEFIKKSY